LSAWLSCMASLWKLHVVDTSPPPRQQVSMLPELLLEPGVDGSARISRATSVSQMRHASNVALKQKGIQRGFSRFSLAYFHFTGRRPHLERGSEVRPRCTRAHCPRSVAAAASSRGDLRETTVPVPRRATAAATAGWSSTQIPPSRNSESAAQGRIASNRRATSNPI
jgi:hypothetical protein